MFSNYTIKKILPRLVIIAIAVNLSFYICVAMVDLSNVLGATLHDFVIGIAKVDPGGETGILYNIGYWTGGAALATAGVLGAIVLILINLGTLAVGLLLTVAVIAFREVLLTILIIISPIAFVLYLLPNTEKWFKKWLTEFARCLFVYPAIAFVWGATELVTHIMLGTKHDIWMFIMAVFLQLAPVAAILPIMKMGGQALSQLQGLAQKGLDKTPLKEWGNNLGKLGVQNARNKIGGMYNKSDEEYKDMHKRAPNFRRWLTRGIGGAGWIAQGKESGSIFSREGLKANLEASKAKSLSQTRLENLKAGYELDPEKIKADTARSAYKHELGAEEKVLMAQAEAAETEVKGRLDRANAILQNKSLEGYTNLVASARAEAQADEKKQVDEYTALINSVAVEQGGKVRKLNNKEQSLLAKGMSLSEVLRRSGEEGGTVRLVQTDATGTVQYDKDRNLKYYGNGTGVGHRLDFKEKNTLQMLGALQNASNWSASEVRDLVDVVDEIENPAVRNAIAAAVASKSLPGIAGSDIPGIQAGTVKLEEAYVRSLISQEIKTNLLDEKPSYIKKYFQAVSEVSNYKDPAEFTNAKRRAVDLLNAMLNDPQRYAALQKSDVWGAITKGTILGSVKETEAPPQGSRYTIDNDEDIVLVTS